MSKKNPLPQAAPAVAAESAPGAPPDGRVVLPSWGGGAAVAAAVLFAGALGISLHLVRLSMTGAAPAGCGPGGGCGDVLGSRWGYVFGLPVSFLGAGLYAFLLFCALCAWPATRAQRRLEWMASVLVLGGALWFTAVQALVLKAFCPWCCTAHALASVGVIALWWARRARPSALPRDPLAAAWMALAAVAVAALAVVQSVGPAPARMRETSIAAAVVAPSGGISLHAGRITLDPAALPGLGLPKATVTAVALTDFTCPHCRELHRTLSQLASERPGQFNVVLVPAAFDPGAREVHRIMLSLWRLDPVQYRQVAEGIVDGAINPSPPELLERLQRQFGGKFYERAWAEAGWVHETLRLGEDLLAINSRESGASILPQLMMGGRVLTGALQASTIIQLIEEAGAAGPLAQGGGTAAPSSTRVPATAVVAAAAPPAPAPAPATGSGPPVIDFGQTTIELGEVPKGETITRKVTFTNSGGAPLTIKNIKAGCGCTTVQGWQQTVAPGGQGSFEIKLDTTNFAGSVTKTVDVESDASNGMVKLFLKADIWSPVRLSASAVTFGNVVKGSIVAPKEIEVTVTTPEPLELGGVTSANPYFQASLKPVEPGRRYQIVVAVPELGDRLQNGDIVLNLGHPRLKELKLSAYINPVNPVVVQPGQIIVPTAALATGTTASVTVLCHDPAVKGFEVTDLAYSGGGGVVVQYERKPSDRWGRVVMTFPAGYVPPAATGSFLSFRTNHPRQPEVKIAVQFMKSRFVPPLAAPPAGPTR